MSDALNETVTDRAKRAYYKKLLNNYYARSTKNTELFIDLMVAVGDNPGITTSALQYEMKHVAIATFYRMLQQLKESNILDTETNKLLVRPWSRNWLIPPVLKNGRLPTVEYRATHLAALLAPLTMEQTPVGFSHTKSQLLKMVQKGLIDDPDRAIALVNQIQNDLALFALFTGDLSAWDNMVGTPQLMDESYLENL